MAQRNTKLKNYLTLHAINYPWYLVLGVNEKIKYNLVFKKGWERLRDFVNIFGTRYEVKSCPNY